MYTRTHSSAAPLSLLFGAFIVGTLLMVSFGCTPRVIVRAHPSENDNGIRYYRPKPYLKIEPAEVAVDKTQTAFAPGMVRISLVYLPDFSEEYSIDVRSGCGIANVGIKLEDGWNLTEISQELDSQTDENIEAIGGLVKAVGGIVPTAATDGSRSDVSFTVPSRNVPIGFYESVVGRDSRGCKRLYGFRYLGFLPYAGCPVDMGGHEQVCCGDGLQPMYGLTFENGTMVFQPLDVMATSPISVPSQHAAATSTSNPTSDLLHAGPNAKSLDLQQMAIELRNALHQQNSTVGEVRARQIDGVVVVTIQLAEDSPVIPVRVAAEYWLLQAIGSADGFDVQIQSSR